MSMEPSEARRRIEVGLKRWLDPFDWDGIGITASLESVPLRIAERP